MKTLVLIRHAHRDTSKGRELDNGLSEKGKKQKRKATQYFLKRFPGKKPALFSSPAKRCWQTIESIAKETGIETLIEGGLWEYTPGESATQFKNRIRKTLQEIQTAKSDVIVLCSHGDWIPMATYVLCGLLIELDKGGWIEFEMHPDKPKLRNVIQKLT